LGLSSFVIGSAAFGGFQVLPGLRYASGKNRLIILPVGIGMHAPEEEGHIASEFGSTGGLAGAEHAITIRRTTKQNLFNKKGRSPAQELWRPIYCARRIG